MCDVFCIFILFIYFLMLFSLLHSFTCFFFFYLTVLSTTNQVLFCQMACHPKPHPKWFTNLLFIIIIIIQIIALKVLLYRCRDSIVYSVIHDIYTKQSTCLTLHENYAYKAYQVIKHQPTL